MCEHLLFWLVANHDINETTSMQVLLEGSSLTGLAFRPDLPCGSIGTI